MSSDITPPPAQPLHLVLWRGLEPGYYLALGTAFFGGLGFVLFDVSWARLLLVLGGFILLVVLVLPYRGMRLWRWGWLRLGHSGAVLLAWLHPARRRQLVTLTTRLGEEGRTPRQHPAAVRPGAETRPLPRSASLEGRSQDGSPSWATAWPASAARPAQHPSSAPAGWDAARRPAPGGRPDARALCGDELDGMPVSAVEAPPARLDDRPSLTLGQIRAWRPAVGPGRSA